MYKNIHHGGGGDRDYFRLSGQGNRCSNEQRSEVMSHVWAKNCVGEKKVNTRRQRRKGV